MLAGAQRVFERLKLEALRIHQIRFRPLIDLYLLRFLFVSVLVGCEALRTVVTLHIRVVIVYEFSRKFVIIRLTERSLTVNEELTFYI